MSSKPATIFSVSDDKTQLLLASAIAIPAVLWFLLSFFRRSGDKKPSLPPGPKGLPIVGNILSLDPELHTYFATLAKDYGPIYKLKLGKKLGIVISSPSIAKEVLKDQDTTFANRDVPVAGREATYGGRDIAWTPYGPEWRMLRKVCVREMLNNKTLDSFYSHRRRELRQMINYLYLQAGSPVNVGDQMFLTMLNVVTSMLWGGTVKEEEKKSIGKEFQEVVREITGLLGIPNLSDFYPGLEGFDVQRIRGKMKGLVERIDRIFETIIEQRRKNEDGRCGESKDFLQFLLKMEDEGDDAKTEFTMAHVKALLVDMVTGGTDTTSNAIEFALAEMINKPPIFNKVQQELDAVIGKDNIVEESDIGKLPYLYAVMKEVLRLHPTLPLLIPHCPSTTSIIEGYTIPEGSRVFVNVWAIHRDPSIWENPLEFCPERFLDRKLDYSGNDFKYLPFGSGRRICAGTAMAERTFMYSLALLVHSFDWSLPEGEKLDLSEKFGIVLKKKVPLRAVLRPRLSDPNLYD